jgi:hypothetical protein
LAGGSQAAAAGVRIGPGIAADNLNNTIVGGPKRQKVSYRFRAQMSARLDSITIYIINGRSGYSGGHGGTLRITVRPDDHTGQHRPTSKVLARKLVNRPALRAGTTYRFPDPPRLVKGRLYHVVFENVDPDPTRNYVSVDGLFVYDEQPVWQPAFPNTDWAHLVRVGDGAWSSDRGPGRGTITPIMGLNYANGQRGGVGYMEVWYREPQSISGPAKVRELFTVGGKSRTVSSAAVRLKRVSGSGPLTLSLKDASGKTIASGQVPASRIAISSASSLRGSRWARATFGRSVKLKARKKYSLVVSTASGSRYSAFPIREGGSYDYGKGSYFARGHAEYTTGSSWRLFTGWGRPSRQADLQFYLR